MSQKQEVIHLLCMIALALQVTAIFTKKWSVLDLKNEDILTSMVGELPSHFESEASIGLWKACGNIWGSVNDVSGNVCGCVDLPVESWESFPKRSLHVVRFFSILGAILMVVGLVYLKKSKKCAATCLLLGGLCSFIATMVWYNNFLEVKLNLDEVTVATLQMSLGYSYYLNLLASLLAIGLGVSCLGKSKGGKQ